MVFLDVGDELNKADEIFYKGCVKEACRAGHYSEREDFAQWAFIKRLEGRKAAIKHLLIDYLRREYGDVRTSSGAKRSFDRRYRKEASFEALRDDTSRSGDSDDSGFERLLVGLSGTDRVIVFLINKWGFSYGEISDCFGVTESRICQRYKGVQKCISERIKKEEPGKRKREAEKTPGKEREKQSWVEFGESKEMERFKPGQAKTYFRPGDEKRMS